MFINDVGQSTWEEVNDGIAGGRTTAGQTSGPGRRPSSALPPIRVTPIPTTPAYYWAITGGAFYARRTRFSRRLPERLFLCRQLRRLDPPLDTTTSTPSPASPPASAGPVDLNVGADGFLYYLARGGRRDLPGGLRQPAAGHHHPPGQPHRFARACGDLPGGGQRHAASVQWQRSRAPTGRNVGRQPPPATPCPTRNSPTTAPASGSTSPTPPATSSATRRVLTVTTNQAPVPTITLPSAGTALRRRPRRSRFTGAGTDPRTARGRQRLHLAG